MFVWGSIQHWQPVFGTRPVREWGVAPASLILCLLLAAGCAAESSSTSASRTVIRDCQLPSDQVGTLSGRWRATPPVPLAFASGQFTEAEMSAIGRAADEWNNFSTRSLGSPLVSYREAGGFRQASMSAPSVACGTTTVVRSAQFTGPVILYKRTNWDPARAEVIAQTNFCPRPDRPVPTFEMAYIELNYQDFFGSGQRAPDLQTIATHEFGHLLGLNHSCENSAQGLAGVPACESSPQDYLEAAMFPVIRFAGLTGEIRNRVTRNDQGRANCLYQGVLSPAS